MIAPLDRKARLMIFTVRIDREPDLWPSPMIAICPVGHSSLAQDYCDVCGLPIDSTTAPPATAPPTSAASAPGHQPCPNCEADNSVDALFCENCGYDFTTGTMPRSTRGTSESPAATHVDQVQPAPTIPAPTIGNGSNAARRDV